MMPADVPPLSIDVIDGWIAANTNKPGAPSFTSRQYGVIKERLIAFVRIAREYPSYLTSPEVVGVFFSEFEMSALKARGNDIAVALTGKPLW